MITAQGHHFIKQASYASRLRPVLKRLFKFKPGTSKNILRTVAGVSAGGALGNQVYKARAPRVNTVRQPQYFHQTAG